MARTFVSSLCIVSAIVALAEPGGAQSAVPVVTLPPATAKSTATLGSVLGIREIGGGKLLVNDAGRRQLRMFDASLATSTIVIDSASGTSRSYGRRPAPLIAYLGDSTLLPDYNSRTMLVLDENGVVARALALPTPTDIGLVRRGSGIDQRGRLFYLGNPAERTPATAERESRQVDSVVILRADFELRSTDTVGRIARPLSKVAAETPDGRGVISIWTVDPLRTLDEWAVLSDGAVAFVRGQDYHVDWVRPTGTTTSTAKLPFDWRRLEYEDKRRIYDSTRTQLLAAAENGTITDIADRIEVMRKPGAAALPPMAGAAPPSGGRGAGGPGGMMAGLKLLPAEDLQLELIPDYYPPIRTGATLADRDGNLWILPTTSKQSLQGELVYDMVNTSGALFQRVRVPLGRLIVGFGAGGTVYMVAGSRTNGFVLERSRLPSAK